MQKWKCQKLFEEFKNDERFHPFILATKNCASIDTTSPQTKLDVSLTYDFFKNHLNLETYYAYNIKKDKHISLKKFDIDIIFFQQPWWNHTKQAPAYCSKFALTCYVPYFVANVASKMEYGLRFHQYLQNHYILNDLIKDFYSFKMRNMGKNLVVSGHCQLDYFLDNDKNVEKKYDIYAPHWSINKPNENYATFEWNGKYILEFAKKHPEISWVFKPHPALKLRLKSENIMSDEEIEKYYSDWSEIGLTYEKGDYLDLFNQSYALITDCGSFLTEYFLTEQPVIHLISDSCYGYNPSAKAIIENYYKAHNLEELKELLEEIIVQKKDEMRAQRVESIEKLGFKGVNASKNIITHLKRKIGLYD